MDGSKIPYTQFNLTNMTISSQFAHFFGQAFNTWVGLGYCPDCLLASQSTNLPSNTSTVHWTTVYGHLEYAQTTAYEISIPWTVAFLICCIILLIAGVAAILVESQTVAPDVLGYVSTVARNSKYLRLPKTNSTMSGGDRLRKLGGYKVMMQDVKPSTEVGQIALGLKTEKAERLKLGRLYR